MLLPLLVVGFHSKLKASEEICSRCYSVWCHTYWFGLRRCAVFDARGERIGDLGPGGLMGSVEGWCQTIQEGTGCR